MTHNDPIELKMMVSWMFLELSYGCVSDYDDGLTDASEYTGNINNPESTRMAYVERMDRK